MKRFLLFTLLILFSSVCVAGELAVIEKDSFDVQKISLIDGFEKVEIDGITAYTSKDFEKEEIFIATDKLFYGSNIGQIDLTVYLGSLNPNNYKIAIELENGKRIDVKEYTINDSKTIPKSSLTDSFEISSVPLTKEINSITLKAIFDPAEIGLKTKFNVVVYDLLGTKVYELDPDLSGCGFKQTVTLNTNGISLGANITNSHAIYGNIPSSNTDFWTNEGYANGNGIRFSPDGVTDLNFHFTDFSGATDDANFFVRLPSFDSSTDEVITLYYDCADSDFQNETGTYPSSHDAVLHLNGDSTYLDSTSNNNDETASTVTRNKGGKLGTASDYDGTDDVVTLNNTLANYGTGDFTEYAWINPRNGTTSQPAVFGKRGAGGSWFRMLINTPNSPLVGESNFGSVVSTSNLSDNTWTQIAVTRTSGTGQAYINGSADGSTSSMSGDIDNTDNFQLGVWGANFDDYEGRIDELKIFDYALSTDEMKLLYNAENDSSSFLTFGSQEIVVVAIDFNVTLNVFQGTGTQFDLNSFNIDFNVDAYDQTGVNSPITIDDVNIGHYLVTISKDNWTDGNTFVLIVSDTNQTLTKTIDKFVNPAIAQFEVKGSTTASLNAFQNVGTFSYDTSYGFSVETEVSCSFWISSDNATEKFAKWRIQSSTDGITWTTRKKTKRTISANTSGGSIYIVTPDFNITDGTQYFRLQNKLSSSDFDLNTNDVVCHNFINVDQNNNIIPCFHDTQTDLSTSSTSYELLTSSSITTNPFNSFLYYYGDMVYNQTVAKGLSFIRGDLENVSDSNSAEYMRTTDAGSSGVGGFAGMFNDLNSNSSYSVQTYGKTTAGTVAFDYDLHLKQLNQRPTRHDQNKFLDSVSFNDTTLIKVASLNLTLTNQADFRALAVLPFSCSVANCDLNTLIQISGNGYDVNSFSHKRTSGATAGDVGVLVNQYLFSDVNSGSISVDLWASTSTGTIDFNGGSFSVIKANETETTIEFPPNPPMIYAPTNGSDVNGSAVDFNCWANDPDNDPLTYDVNIIFRDTNATALVLQTGGDGNGDFNSSALANGTYSFNCSVTDTNFTATFENGDYNFTITNPLPITPAITKYVISDLCEIEVSVKEEDDYYYFSANIIDTNGFSGQLNTTISFYNQKFETEIFSNKEMKEKLKGNYLYSTTMILENGQYSFLIDVDSNCFKSFNYILEGKPPITRFPNIVTPQTKIINNTSPFDIWDFLNKTGEINLIIIIFILLGVFYVAWKRK